MRTRSLLAAVMLAAAPALLHGSQSDVDLTRGVRAALERCSHYTVFDDVAIDVSNGVVTLAGEVTSTAKRAGIAADVRRVAGVRRVVDDLAVLPASPGDADLRRRAAHALYSHPAFWRYAAMPSPPIHIVVRDGGIRLTGAVQTTVERALAASIVSGTGARTVTNALTVR